MGFSKLREWVGTMTGKGVSWGRDSVGRSEPAFLSASTIALPPPTCTARGRRHLRLFVCCQAGHLWPLFLQGLCRAESPPAASACSAVQQAVLCLPATLPAMPTALISSCPRSFALCFAPFIFALFAPVHPCAPGSSVRASSLLGPAVCKLRDCPVGSCNTGLQWRPVHRSI